MLFRSKLEGIPSDGIYHSYFMGAVPFLEDAFSSGVISMECWVDVSMPSAFSEITSMFFCLLTHANPCDLVSKLCVVTLPFSFFLRDRPLFFLCFSITYKVLPNIMDRGIVKEWIYSYWKRKKKKRLEPF